MKRAAAILLTVFLFVACHKGDGNATSTSTTATSTTDTRDKTVAEKAFDAGMRARKKAEQIKADEDKKVQETNTAGNE